MMSALSDLFGPIFAKELVEMARRWRYYLSRIAFGSVLLLVLFVVYENTYYRTRQLPSTKAMSYMAEQFFLTVCWVQYAAVFLLVPMFLSGVIAGERDEKTLELLFTTQLSNREIIWGKLGSRVTSVLMLVLSGLPVIALMMLFGGVNPTVLFRVACATLLAVLFVSAFAMYFSVTTRNPMGAMLRTYTWLAVWLGLVTLVVILIVEMAPRPRSRTFEDVVYSTLCMINPVGNFGCAVVEDLNRNLLRVVGRGYFPMTFLIPTIWALYLIARSMQLVRREPRPGRLWAWVKRVLLRIGRWLASWFVHEHRAARPGLLARLSDPTRALFVIPVENPFWLRARRTYVYDREGHLRRIQWGAFSIVAGITLLFALFKSRELRDDDLGVAFQAGLWLGLGAVGCLLGGYSLLGERRRGFLEIVLTTPLTAGEVIRGTFLAIWRHISLTYLLLIVIGLFFVATGAFRFPNLVGSIITGTLFLCLMIYHGIACSLAARTMPGALVGTFCLPLATLLGVMPLVGFLRQSAGPVLWAICVIALPITWLAVRHRATVFRMTLFLIFVHLSLCSLFTWWTSEDTRPYSPYPIAAMHPGFLTMASLEHRSYIVDQWDSGPRWVSILLSYWLAVVFNLIWLHVWVCWNYDRLCGRADGPSRRKPPTQEHAERVPAIALLSD
jgi:ABC-type transport system involved in multi-copper enzyme maturation permease subunit